MKLDGNIIEINNEGKIEEPYSKKGYVSLPFTEDDFKEFIVGLLGEPQTIEGKFYGNFCIERKQIENLFHIIDQRISQQNKAFLVGFISKIAYDNKTMVTLNGYNELITYNEVNPITPVAIELTWIYMVHFHDKSFPEKQEINISFIREEEYKDYYEDSLFELRNMSKSGVIQYRIAHTARTWGIDIQNLLTNHIKSIINEPNKFKKLIIKHRRKVSIILSTVTAFGLFLLSIRIVNSANNNFLTLVNYTLKNLSNDINAKIDFLIQSIANGKLYQNNNNLTLCGLCSLLMGTTIQLISLTSLRNIYIPSFILLTDQSRKDKDLKEKKLSKKWLLFCLSIISSLSLGVVSNIIYYFVSKLW